MALPIKITATSGGGNTRFYATLKRRDTGHRWSVAASAWEASPTYSNSKIALSEGASEYLGSYSASVSGLGDPGVIDIIFHDASDSDKVIAQAPARVVGGDEVDLFPGTGLTLTESRAAALNFMLDINKLGEAIDDAANDATTFKTNMTTANGWNDQSLRTLTFGANGNANDTLTRYIVSGGHNLTTGVILLNRALSIVPEDEDEFRIDGFVGT